LVAVLCCLALALQTVIAHETVPAGNVERNDDPVTDFEVVGLAADLLDHAHRLVAEDVAGCHEGAEHLVQMQVRAADVGACHADDRVGRFLDDRVGHVFDGHLAPGLPRHGSH
jgi:hypothetical protein